MRKGYIMYVVEITEDKLSGLSEHIEKALSHMGKVMQCVSELEDESKHSEISERNPVRSYDRYSHRNSYRDWDEDRQGYERSGRYSRY